MTNMDRIDVAVVILIASFLWNGYYLHRIRDYLRRIADALEKEK